MNEERIRQLLAQGEGLLVEFKTCRSALNRDVYETICAFLNRCGGDLLLGVTDNGEVRGVDSAAVEQLKKDFATALNNPQKINPPFYLHLEEVAFEDKTLLHVFVPESSQVHRCNGRIFDRNADGDFNITDNTHLVTALYQRKQTSYSENRIFPYVQLSDLRGDLIARARKLAANERPDHPWQDMDDRELLQSAQLYGRDFQTGQEGFTLAAVLLLGRDDVILSILPHHRTDAILRRKNLDRYDDRDDIRTNLLESYDRLMAFVAKHLPDSFYLEGTQRISIRDHIFREVTANLLIHREFLNAFPAKLVIEAGQVRTENANRPHGHGLIDPASFSPFPKNPIIARFFKEIGRADELGSGVRKLFRYCQAYGGANPELVENDIFRFILPLPSLEQMPENSAGVRVISIVDTSVQVTEQVTEQATEQATEQSTEQEAKLLEFCRTPRSREEIQAFLNLKHREHFRAEILKPLLEKGLLSPTIPEKPTSPKQKYYAAQHEGDN
jgi:ATP-dependent DNA helicase RecG